MRRVPIDCTCPRGPADSRGPGEGESGRTSASTEFPQLNFTGNASLSSAELTEVIRLQWAEHEGSVVDKSNIDDFAYEIELHYRSIGFPFAYVDYEFEAKGAPRTATFSIQEGARIEVTRFTTEGNLAPGFSKDEIQDLFAPSTGSFWVPPGAGSCVPNWRKACANWRRATCPRAS